MWSAEIKNKIIQKIGPIINDLIIKFLNAVGKYNFNDINKDEFRHMAIGNEREKWFIDILKKLPPDAFSNIPALNNLDSYFKSRFVKQI